MRGFSITVIPGSWAFGRWDIRKKTLWALGPLRFGIHRGLRGTYGVDAVGNPNGLTEAEGFLVETALDLGFEMVNSNGDIYRCTEIQLIDLCRLVQDAAFHGTLPENRQL